MIKINKYLVPYIIFLLIVGFKGEIAISMIMVFFHELMHLLAARFFSISAINIEVLPFGAVLKLKDLDEASPLEDLVISLTGPIMNLFIALIFYWLNLEHPCYAYNVIKQTNLALGVFNLIPAYPMDGGRALKDVLSLKMLYKEAHKHTIYISIIGGVVLICFFVLLYCNGIENYNVGLIAIFIIVCSIKEKERVAYIIMGDIIKKKYRFMKRGYIENKSISVHYRKDLLEVLSILDKNKYNVFIVLNDEMKIQGIIYEEEILEALKIYGNISIGEYLKLVDS